MRPAPGPPPHRRVGLWWTGQWGCPRGPEPETHEAVSGEGQPTRPTPWPSPSRVDGHPGTGSQLPHGDEDMAVPAPFLCPRQTRPQTQELSPTVAALPALGSQLSTGGGSSASVSACRGPGPLRAGRCTGAAQGWSPVALGGPAALTAETWGEAWSGAPLAAGPWATRWVSCPCEAHTRLPPPAVGRVARRNGSPRPGTALCADGWPCSGKRPAGALLGVRGEVSGGRVLSAGPATRVGAVPVRGPRPCSPRQEDRGRAAGARPGRRPTHRRSLCPQTPLRPGPTPALQPPERPSARQAGGHAQPSPRPESRQALSAEAGATEKRSGLNRAPEAPPPPTSGSLPPLRGPSQPTPTPTRDKAPSPAPRARLFAQWPRVCAWWPLSVTPGLPGPQPPPQP